ncbi:MAG: glycosyltransferase family 4 protein [Caldilineaceae bacterium]|nr:glycosyltransferase family 4 protein [Caldilineaceae bacterium]
MRPLKICMVTTFYPPANFGGDGIFVYRLTNALARYGHEVHVVHDVDAFHLLSSRPPQHNFPHPPNVVLHPLEYGKRGEIDLLMVHQLGRPLLKHAALQELLAGEQFDVIHFHNISLLGGPGILRYGNALKLCTLHECWFVCPMHVLWRFDREPCTRRTCLACTLHGRRPPQLWRYTGQRDRDIAQVDAFIGPSHFVEEIYHRHGFPAPIRYLPYFFPDAEAAAAGEGAAQASAPNEGRPYFLFVGRLEKIKGVQVLIEAFRYFCQADLLIAGAGAYEPELRAMAQGLSHVRFLGLLDHARLRTLYRHAIATLIPSLCYETFGWPTLESFVVSTPVIVPDRGALPEIVRNGGGLVYTDQAELIEAMATLQHSPALRDALGAEGYAGYRTHYSEESHLAQYHRLLGDLGGFN